MKSSFPVRKYRAFGTSRSLNGNGTASPDMQNAPFFEKLRYDRQTAADMLSISIRSLDYRISTGQIRARRDGNKVLIQHGELVRYARADHPHPVRIRPNSNPAAQAQIAAAPAISAPGPQGGHSMN